MEETLSYIKSILKGFEPEIAVVLGSGLGGFTDGLDGISIDYKDIPNFKTSSVVGHNSKLFFTELFGKKLAVMQGRLHFYEGHTLAETTYPIKVLKKLGVKTIILSNASGGINENYQAGDLVAINDHINFLGTNPLIGKNDDELGTRFPDMSEVYNKNLIKIAHETAKELNIELKDGVYLSTTGPSYETPAEIRMFKIWGADMVGMSTVPEAIIANYMGLNVLAISLITNLASGISKTKLAHQEVVELGRIAGEKFKTLVKKIIEKI